MKRAISYTLIAVVIGLAYPLGREIMIRQEPEGYVITSAFTLNYLLLFVIAGAISPWLAVRVPMLKRLKKRTANSIVMLTLVGTLLIVLTLVGMPMRWVE